MLSSRASVSREEGGTQAWRRPPTASAPVTSPPRASTSCCARAEEAPSCTMRTCTRPSSIRRPVSSAERAGSPWDRCISRPSSLASSGRPFSGRESGDSARDSTAGRAGGVAVDEATGVPARVCGEASTRQSTARRPVLRSSRWGGMWSPVGVVWVGCATRPALCAPHGAGRPTGPSPERCAPQPPSSRASNSLRIMAVAPQTTCCW